jgi:thiol-disulfide isomerase/thioredoxin
MKPLLLSVFTAAILSSTVSAQSKLVPIDETGYPKLLATHKGKVVLTSFWATWCVPCRKEMPDLVKLSQRLSARGFDLVTISNDEPDREAAALKVLQDNKVSGAVYWLRPVDREKFYHLVDGNWEDGSLPALFLYDRAGKKTRVFIGETSVTDLEAAIAKLL